MKYFTYGLVAAANDWIDQSEEESRLAEQQFWATVEDYHRELEELKSRVSKAAWNFFRYGFARYGLHDANLLSLSVGDGLDYVADGVSPFLLNRQRTSAKIKFLNFEQDLHYLFDLRGVKRIETDLFIEESLYAKSIGDLFTYELTGVNESLLQLSFLFASGATFTIQFQKLVFRRNRIKRKNEVGEIYG
jgi:hypothetical protein